MSQVHRSIQKICNIKLLKEWKKKCIINSQGYAGQNLPLIDEIPIDGIEAEDNTFEINTPVCISNLIFDLLFDILIELLSCSNKDIS